MSTPGTALPGSGTLELPLFSLDVQALDLGDEVKAVGLELIETQNREPVRGKDAAQMDRDYELQTHQAEDRHWWYRGRRTVIENVIAGMRLPARARILDAGCGSGRNMVELAHHGTVTGVELSPTSVALARERDAGEVVECSILEMPFGVGSLSACP